MIQVARFKAAGRSLEVCKELLRQEDEVKRVHQCARKMYGAEQAVEQHGRMIGVAFAEGASIPYGWKIKKGQAVLVTPHKTRPFCVPDRRTAQGRIWAKELAQIPQFPDPWRVSKALGIPGGDSVISGNKMYYKAQIEGGPDDFVIHVYYTDGAPEVPPDAVEMLVSEYAAWKQARG